MARRSLSEAIAHAEQTLDQLGIEEWDECVKREDELSELGVDMFSALDALHGAPSGIE